jgi:hypothetical protein
MLPVLEQAKKVRASESAATVIGLSSHSDPNISLDPLPST